MYKIKAKVNGKEEVFSGLVMSRDENLEFSKNSNEFLDRFRFSFNEKAKRLESLTTSSEPGIFIAIKLSDQQIDKLVKIKKETRGIIIKFVNDILSGKEELLLLEMPGDDYPYLITSETALDSKVKSPKYDEAIQYVFSDKVLEVNNKKIDFQFSNYEEFQRELGQEIKKRNLKANYDYKGQKALKLKWGDIVKNKSV